MPSLNSIDEIRRALAEREPSTVMAQAKDFLIQASQEKRKEVKQLLFEITEQYPEARWHTLGWLAQFADRDVLELLLRYLHNDELQCEVILCLDVLVSQKVIQPDESVVVEALVHILSSSSNSYVQANVIAVLINLQAISAIDVVAAYLEDKNGDVRERAAKCVIKLSALAGRSDLLTKVEYRLRDTYIPVRVITAMTLREYYPKQYGHLNVEDYMK